VIGNYQGEHLLPECLESLREQAQQPTEVIVVDGSSTDEGVAVAERAGAFVIRSANSGLGFLYNRGAEAAHAPYVLFLNNDVALERNCVAQLAAALDEDPLRFAADAQQLDWAGTRTIHARTTLARGRLAHEYLPGLHLDPVVPSDDVVPTVCANGAAMLVRRHRHLELGGFDETFFMEWEDLDLCWRAWLRGWPTVYVPHASLRHRVGAATHGEMTDRRQASSHHNILRFALKCLPPGAVTRVVVGELLRWPRYPAPIGRALVAVLGELPELVRLRRSIRPSRALLRTMLADHRMGARLG
jgi:GT2 family glycosyltransferase